MKTKIVLFCMCWLIFASCKSKNVSNVVADANNPIKTFNGYGALNEGDCKLDLAFWKVDFKDYINRPIKIDPNNRNLEIRGMIRDLKAQNSGAALFADVDGTRFEGVIGIKVPLPTFPDAGYYFEIPQDKLSPGTHKVRFYSVNKEGNAYCEYTDKILEVVIR